MIDRCAFHDKLEPEAKALADVTIITIDGDKLAQISIAISLKRIADSLDHICNYGIKHD